MTSGDVVFKTHVEPVETESEADAWNTWLSTTIERTYEPALHEAIAEILVEERVQHHRETEKMLEPLRRELAELRGQISTLILLSGAKPADLAEAIEAAKTPGPRGLQGPPGRRGERGHRGEAGPSIVRWALDRERYLAYPLMSHGRPGPALELRGLFEQYQRETNG
jgi:hypothetical protein